MTTFTDVKRHGCPASLAVPVFFCFYSGLTLLFGGLAVYNVRNKPSQVRDRNGAYIAIAIGGALIVTCFCHIGGVLFLLPTLKRRLQGRGPRVYVDTMGNKSSEDVSVDVVASSVPDVSDEPVDPVKPTR